MSHLCYLSVSKETCMLLESQKLHLKKPGDNAFMFINSTVLSGVFCAALNTYSIKICIRMRNVWLLTKKDDEML